MAGFDPILLVQTGELGLKEPVECLRDKLGEFGVEDEVWTEDVQAGVEQLDQCSENIELAPLLVTDIGLGCWCLEGLAKDGREHRFKQTYAFFLECLHG